MMPLTLQQICEALSIAPMANGTAVIQSICTDTRKITPGCLFIAIKGESHDGHDHVQAAAAAGAVAAMVDRDIQTDLPLVRVDDTRKAMGRLANHIRRQLKCTVIAVAGSNGKTGTKNLIHSVLKGSLRGSISPKSFNNDIGVPTTIFAADPADDYLVLEIGTNHPGEILNLTKIAEPDVAIITNIGNEHLEFLGDLDGVTKENAQITAGMNHDGLLILNGDHAPLLSAVADYPGRRTTFGIDPLNDLRANQVRMSLEGVHFRLNSSPQPEFFIPLLGRHTAINALAAIAVGQHLGLTDDAIRAGLASATGPEMRLQLQAAGNVRILNDAYNANPNSMRAALETLRDVETHGRRVAILGDMFELGPVAIPHHREIGQFAASCDLDQLICIGKLASLIAEEAIQAGMPANRVAHFATVAECAAAIPALIQEDDLILLKGSNGMKLGTLVPNISSFATERSLRRVVAGRERAVTLDSTPASEKVGR